MKFLKDLDDSLMSDAEKKGVMKERAALLDKAVTVREELLAEMEAEEPRHQRIRKGDAKRIKQQYLNPEEFEID